MVLKLVRNLLPALFVILDNLVSQVAQGMELKSPPVLIDHGILFSSSDRHTLDLLMINLDTRFTRSGGLERAFLSI